MKKLLFGRKGRKSCHFEENMSRNIAKYISLLRTLEFEVNYVHATLQNVVFLTRVFCLFSDRLFRVLIASCTDICVIY